MLEDDHVAQAATTKDVPGGDDAKRALDPGCWHRGLAIAVPVQQAFVDITVQRAFTQTVSPAESDRNTALRMLDRVARIAERVIRTSDPKAKHKFTPHLAVNLLPDGSLGISGNTGKKVVTDEQRKTIEKEIQTFAEGTAPRKGHHGHSSSSEERQRERRDRSKLRAFEDGVYVSHHPESPELAEIQAALHKPIKWFAISTPVRQSVPAQHGEMTLLGEQVTGWKRAPRDQDNPKTVYMGGVKLACVACQWAFEAVNRHLGHELGYRVVAAGTHGQFFPNWLMPPWMRTEKAVVNEIRVRAAEYDAVLDSNWVIRGEMATGDFVHDPSNSSSDYESD
ncbi:hypothetical protein [Streptomyces sp. NPDC005799]|uniref:hypothetical protein n=1 Tax=Streptomyces sp. NPDC005799 TaxID=3154678 RepID=UPI0033CA7D42